MPSKRLPTILIALILLLAAAFRTYGLRWEDDLTGYPHPDERHLANTMSRIAIPAPIDWSTLLNDAGHSPLNPRRLISGQGDEHFDLAYGTLPVYLYRATAVILSKVTGNAALDSYQSYGTIGRAITALFSLLTVFWAYKIGQRTFGTPTALLATALLAACVLHIQLSHFMTVDLLMSAMLTAGLLYAVRFAQSGRTSDAIGMGVMLGLGMACKFNGITLGAGIAAAYMVAWLGGKRTLGYLLSYGVPLTLVFWVVCFALFEYYAIRDPYTYAHAIGVQAKMVSGETDWPYTRQYVNTAPYLFQLKNLVAWGMGWPLGIAAVAGTVYAAIGLGIELLLGKGDPNGPTGLSAMKARIVRWFDHPRRAGVMVMLGWTIPFFAYTARLEVKFLRYMLPLVPVLCLLAAQLMIQVGTLLSGKAGKRQVIVWGPVAVVLVPTLLWALAYMRVYAQEHPWQAASRWFFQNAPRGSYYTWEAWGDRLPVDLPREDLHRAQYGLLQREILMHIYHNLPPGQKLAHIVGSLRQADYVILSTPRLYMSVARSPWRYPVEIRYYELLFTGQLGYELAQKFTAFPGLGPWEIVDLSADQSFFDYEHPLVLVYRKTRDLSDSEWRQLFAAQLATEPRVTRKGDEPPAQLPIPVNSEHRRLTAPHP